MAVLLTVLKVLGIAILIVLALLLIILLLVLFVPFRYSFSGSIDDPEGSREILHLDPKKDLFFEGGVQWLFGAVYAGAMVGRPGEQESLVRLQARVFGKGIPLDKILNRPKKEGGEEKKEEPKAPEEKKSLDEKIEAILKKVEKITRRIDDALYALRTEYGTRARNVILTRVLYMLEKTLPAKWGLTGVIGLGDPSRSAKVFAVQGYLYPVTAGHVMIGTDYDLYRYDLRGAAQGSIRLFTFLYGGIRILLSKDVRRLIGRLRRGPAPGHRVGNGNGSSGSNGKNKAASSAAS